MRMIGRIKDRYMNEIKVGDIVRVSEDVPRMYLRTMQTTFLGEDCKVYDIVEDNAAITSGRDYIAIPLKYLIKVNAEPKYSKGDKVSYCGELYVVTNYSVVGRENNIHYAIERDYDKSITSVAERFLKPYTEPKEPTEKPNVGKIAIPVEADLTDTFWDAYTADLAKEIAVKIVGSQLHSHKPYEVGEMAVEVAKSVVENLKRKRNEPGVYV